VGSREARHLSKACEQVVIGTLLGDGCLERNGRHVRLRIDHSVRQKAFVDWKFRMLGELSPASPRLVKRVESRTGRVQCNYRFGTRSTPVLEKYFSLFYPGGKKRISEDIGHFLVTPLSIAVWYMDDGSRRGDCRSGYLNTNAYSVGDVELLRRTLLQNFDIATSLHFAAGRPRIYIPAASFGQFCGLIRSHVIDQMSYKLL
jgi:LAGLIDADG DNA endonuclease family